MIVEATEGGWYVSHEMDGSGFLRDENVERSIFRCASPMSVSEDGRVHLELLDH